MKKNPCIFETDELKHLCDMVQCPTVSEAKNKCIAACYTCLVEHYIKMLQKQVVLTDAD